MRPMTRPDCCYSCPSPRAAQDKPPRRRRRSGGGRRRPQPVRRWREPRGTPRTSTAPRLRRTRGADAHDARRRQRQADDRARRAAPPRSARRRVTVARRRTSGDPTGAGARGHRARPRVGMSTNQTAARDARRAARRRARRARFASFLKFASKSSIVERRRGLKFGGHRSSA